MKFKIPGPIRFSPRSGHISAPIQPRRRTGWRAAGIAVLLFAALLILLPSFPSWFDRCVISYLDRHQGAMAILATVALIVVTTHYVVLTRRLVRLQEQSQEVRPYHKLDILYNTATTHLLTLWIENRFPSTLVLNEMVLTAIAYLPDETMVLSNPVRKPLNDEPIMYGKKIKIRFHFSVNQWPEDGRPVTLSGVILNFMVMYQGPTDEAPVPYQFWEYVL